LSPGAGNPYYWLLASGSIQGVRFQVSGVRGQKSEIRRQTTNTGNKKPDTNQFSPVRISNIEQGIPNDEVFLPFDIHYSLFDSAELVAGGVLRFSFF
jgi:hypothetical protein